jgi:hypothetical protein
MTTPADSVWRVGFTEERAVVVSSQSGYTSMKVFSFEPAEVVAEKTAARARAKEQAAAQVLRDLKKKARADPETTMEVDEEENDSDYYGKGLWGGMDMVRESSKMGVNSETDARMWDLGTTLTRETSSSSDVTGPSSLGGSGR